MRTIHARAATAATYQPISATNHARTAYPVLTEGEHAQLALLNDHEHVHPGLRLRSLAGRFPVLLPAQHALLRPRWPKESKLLVGDADVRRRAVAVDAVLVIFALLPDNSVREVRGEPEGGSEEGYSGADALDGIQ